MKSFFESLSKEQQEAVKNYRGPENHGSEEFKLKNKETLRSSYFRIFKDSMSKIFIR